MATTLFTRFSLPDGLGEIVEGLAKEVLKNHFTEPLDIYNTAWQHFSDQLARRKDHRSKASQVSGYSRRTSDVSNRSYEKHQGGVKGTRRNTGPRASKVSTAGLPDKEGGQGRSIFRATSLDRDNRQRRRSQPSEGRGKIEKSMSLDRRHHIGVSVIKTKLDGKVNKAENSNQTQKDTFSSTGKKGKKTDSRNSKVSRTVIGGGVMVGATAAAASIVSTQVEDASNTVENGADNVDLDLDNSEESATIPDDVATDIAQLSEHTAEDRGDGAEEDIACGTVEEQDTTDAGDAAEPVSPNSDHGGEYAAAEVETVEVVENVENGENVGKKVEEAEEVAQTTLNAPESDITISDTTTEHAAESAEDMAKTSGDAGDVNDDIAQSTAGPIESGTIEAEKAATTDVDDRSIAEGGEDTLKGDHATSANGSVPGAEDGVELSRTASDDKDVTQSEYNGESDEHVAKALDVIDIGKDVEEESSSFAEKSGSVEEPGTIDPEDAANKAVDDKIVVEGVDIVEAGDVTLDSGAAAEGIEESANTVSDQIDAAKTEDAGEAGESGVKTHVADLDVGNHAEEASGDVVENVGLVVETVTVDTKEATTKANEDGEGYGIISNTGNDSELADDDKLREAENVEHKAENEVKSAEEQKNMAAETTDVTDEKANEAGDVSGVLAAGPEDSNKEETKDAGNDDKDHQDTLKDADTHGSDVTDTTIGIKHGDEVTDGDSKAVDFVEKGENVKEEAENKAGNVSEDSQDVTSNVATDAGDVDKNVVSEIIDEAKDVGDALKATDVVYSSGLVSTDVTGVEGEEAGGGVAKDDTADTSATPDVFANALDITDAVPEVADKVEDVAQYCEDVTENVTVEEGDGSKDVAADNDVSKDVVTLGDEETSKDGTVDKVIVSEEIAIDADNGKALAEVTEAVSGDQKDEAEQKSAESEQCLVGNTGEAAEELTGGNVVATECITAGSGGADDNESTVKNMATGAEDAAGNVSIYDMDGTELVMGNTSDLAEDVSKPVDTDGIIALDISQGVENEAVDSEQTVTDPPEDARDAAKDEAPNEKVTAEVIALDSIDTVAADIVQVENKLEDFGQNIADSLQDTGDAAIDEPTNGIVGAEDIVADYKDAAGDIVQVENGVADNGKEIMDLSEDIGDAVKDEVANGIVAAEDFSGNFKDSVADLAQVENGTIGDANAITDPIVDTIDAMKDAKANENVATKDVVAGSGDVVADVAHVGSGTINDSKTITDPIVDTIDAMKDVTANENVAAEDVVAGSGDVVADVAHVENEATDDAKAITDPLVDTIDAAKDEVANGIVAVENASADSKDAIADIAQVENGTVDGEKSSIDPLVDITDAAKDEAANGIVAVEEFSTARDAAADVAQEINGAVDAEKVIVMDLPEGTGDATKDEAANGIVAAAEDVSANSKDPVTDVAQVENGARDGEESILDQLLTTTDPTKDEAANGIVVVEDVVADSKDAAADVVQVENGTKDGEKSILDQLVATTDPTKDEAANGVVVVEDVVADTRDATADITQDKNGVADNVKEIIDPLEGTGGVAKDEGTNGIVTAEDVLADSKDASVDVPQEENRAVDGTDGIIDPPADTLNAAKDETVNGIVAAEDVLVDSKDATAAVAKDENGAADNGEEIKDSPEDTGDTTKGEAANGNAAPEDVVVDSKDAAVDVPQEGNGGVDGTEGIIDPPADTGDAAIDEAANGNVAAEDVSGDSKDAAADILMTLETADVDKLEFVTDTAENLAVDTGEDYINKFVEAEYAAENVAGVGSEASTLNPIAMPLVNQNEGSDAKNALEDKTADPNVAATNDDIHITETLLENMAAEKEGTDNVVACSGDGDVAKDVAGDAGNKMEDMSVVVVGGNENATNAVKDVAEAVEIIAEDMTAGIDIGVINENKTEDMEDAAKDEAENNENATNAVKDVAEAVEIIAEDMSVDTGVVNENKDTGDAAKDVVVSSKSAHENETNEAGDASENMVVDVSDPADFVAPKISVNSEDVTKETGNVDENMTSNALDDGEVLEIITSGTGDENGEAYTDDPTKDVAKDSEILVKYIAASIDDKPEDVTAESADIESIVPPSAIDIAEYVAADIENYSNNIAAGIEEVTGTKQGAEYVTDTQEASEEMVVRTENAANDLNVTEDVIKDNGDVVKDSAAETEYKSQTMSTNEGDATLYLTGDISKDMTTDNGGGSEDVVKNDTLETITNRGVKTDTDDNSDTTGAAGSGGDLGGNDTNKDIMDVPGDMDTKVLSATEDLMMDYSAGTDQNNETSVLDPTNSGDVADDKSGGLREITEGVSVDIEKATTDVAFDFIGDKVEEVTADKSDGSESNVKDTTEHFADNTDNANTGGAEAITDAAGEDKAEIANLIDTAENVAADTGGLPITADLVSGNTTDDINPDSTGAVTDIIPDSKDTTDLGANTTYTEEIVTPNVTDTAKDEVQDGGGPTDDVCGNGTDKHENLQADSENEVQAVGADVDVTPNETDVAADVVTNATTSAEDVVKETNDVVNPVTADSAEVKKDDEANEMKEALEVAAEDGKEAEDMATKADVTDKNEAVATMDAVIDLPDEAAGGVGNEASLDFESPAGDVAAQGGDKTENISADA